MAHPLTIEVGTVDGSPESCSLVCINGVFADKPGQMRAVCRGKGPDDQSTAAFIRQICVDMNGLSRKKGIRDLEAKADVTDVDSGPQLDLTIMVRPIDDLAIVHVTPHFSS